MGEHRVPALTSGLRRYPDPETSSDPRIRELLTELRTLEPAPAPRAHFRAELRSQLVSVTPRLVAEGVSIENPVARRAALAKPAHADSPIGLLGRLGSLSLGRPIAAVTAVIAAFALLLGGAVYASHNALPGDTLYGLKRADENVQLSLTSGTARGKEYLALAARRTDEVEKLLSRATATAGGAGINASGALSPHTLKLVNDTLNSADSDLRSAAQVLGQEAVSSHSSAPLASMLAWAPAQAARLQQIAAHVPINSPLVNRVASSQQLVTAAVDRSVELQQVVNAGMTPTTSDSIGPIPCTSAACLVTPPTLPLPTTGIVPSPGSAVPTGPVSPGVTSGGASGSSSAGQSGTPTTPHPGFTLPTLPSVPGIGQITLPTIGGPHPTNTGTGTPTGSPTCLLVLLGVCVKI